jgi:D-alanyl-D-alanine dipeptidase
MAELVDFSTQLLAHFIDHGLTRKTRKQSPGKANLSGSVQGGFHWNDTTPRLGADSVNLTVRSASAWQVAAGLVAGLAGAPCCAGHAAEQQAGPPPATSTAGQRVQADSVKLASDQVADSLLVDVRSLDPAILVDLRYATANNFTGAVLPGYQAQKALLRREAAQALTRVEARLRTGGLGLRIWDAYRPLRATMAMVAWAESTGRTDLLDQEYIARRSRHNLGVAVDLTLVDLVTGTELDLGTPFDTFSDAARTANAEGRVLRYRQVLVRAMESEGFQNYEKEWWHFSYTVPDPQAFDVPIR